MTEQNEGCELPGCSPAALCTRASILPWQVAKAQDGGLQEDLLKFHPEPHLAIGCKYRYKKSYPTIEIQADCLSSTEPLSFDPEQCMVLL